VSVMVSAGIDSDRPQSGGLSGTRILPSLQVVRKGKNLHVTLVSMRLAGPAPCR
jgi:hypothetical protein